MVVNRVFRVIILDGLARILFFPCQDTYLAQQWIASFRGTTISENGRDCDLIQEAMSSWVRIEPLSSSDVVIEKYLESNIAFKFIYWNVIEQDTANLDFPEQVY